VQQLALVTYGSEESRAKAEEEDSRFRSMIIAYHLGEAKKILDIMDGAQDDAERFAPELSEEEMLEYQPLSTEEADAAIDMLRSLGVAVQ
jgi:hypothetical protein